MSLPEKLFGCFTGDGWLLGCLCPCALAAQNHSLHDDRPLTLCDCLCSSPCTQYAFRQQLRTEMNAVYTPCSDCLAASLCFPCFNCQNHRLAKIKYAKCLRYNMSIPVLTI
ncbi:hypothetical protein GEMRC1_011505 [Eukaryota sp. GEM-RC1]